MERKQATTTVFLLVLAATALYFCYVIARPFLSPIFLAVMIAIVFHPVHARLQAGIRRRNAAELGGWNPYVMHAIERLLGWAGRYIDLSTLDLRGALLRWLEQISRFLLSWGAQAVRNIISFFADAVIAFVTLFFLFREGGSMREHAAEVLPLKAGQVERLFTGISNSIVANVYGCLAVGIAQGTLLSLAFWVLGLPSPVLWGLVTALFSLIPIIGSAAVWAPAVIILVAGGHWWKGLILLAWGAAVVGQVDSLVRPYVIGERAKLHTLLVFFALLGGVKAFGVMGLFIGPVVLSITLVVLDMLREMNLDYPRPDSRQPSSPGAGLGQG